MKLVMSFELGIKVFLCTACRASRRIAFLHKQILKVRLRVSHLLLLALELDQDNESIFL